MGDGCGGWVYFKSNGTCILFYLEHVGGPESEPSTKVMARGDLPPLPGEKFRLVILKHDVYVQGTCLGKDDDVTFLKIACLDINHHASKSELHFMPKVQ